MESSVMYWNMIWPLLLAICVPSILVVAIRISTKLGKRLDLQNRNILNDFIMSVVAQGVSFAEQLSIKRAKDNIGVTSDDKLTLAMRYITEELVRNNVLNVTGEEISKKIEAYLGYSNMNDGGVVISDESEDFNGKDSFGN